MWIRFSLLVSLLSGWTCGQQYKDASVVHQWVALDYDWPDNQTRDQYIQEGKFIIQNNIITGIKLYKHILFLTVPRWRPGVPATLNRVVRTPDNGVSLLQPFPSWDWNKEGNCSALQYVQSMEVDPNTGIMWILDNGRTNILEANPINKCPPRLVLYDINTNHLVRIHVFPNHVVNYSTAFVNDIVLHYVGGHVAYAYMSEAFDGKLYVYDYDKDQSYFFTDPSMYADLPNGGKVSINGIALAANFDYLYYGAIDGAGIYQIATQVLMDRNAIFKDHVRRVGTKESRVGGMAYGQDCVYFGLLDRNGIQRWEIRKDAEVSPGGGYGNVSMRSLELVVQNDTVMRWADTLGWGEGGYLWFTAIDLSRYSNRSMNFSGLEPNMRVWKVFVNDSSYLAFPLGTNTKLTSPSSATPLALWPGNGLSVFLLLLLLLLLMTAIAH